MCRVAKKKLNRDPIYIHWYISMRVGDLLLETWVTPSLLGSLEFSNVVPSAVPEPIVTAVN